MLCSVETSSDATESLKNQTDELIIKISDELIKSTTPSPASVNLSSISIKTHITIHNMSVTSLTSTSTTASDMYVGLLLIFMGGMIVFTVILLYCRIKRGQFM